MALTILLQLSDWVLFFGRLHPLLVHLPIGFLLIAFLLEAGQRVAKLPVTGSTKAFVLLSGAIGATLSCLVGFLLASGGEYNDDTLSNHQWQGVGVAAFSWVAWIANYGSLAARFNRLQALYLPAFGLALLLMFSAGHLGGNLTHGEGYLLQYAPDPVRAMAGFPPKETSGSDSEIKPLADVQQAVVYSDIVQPILNMRCVQCHGSAKKKGNLRLDGYEHVVKGGENGPVLNVGKGAESRLIQVCLLPMGDDMRMPPKGKPQLTDSQVRLINWWIDQGASKDKRVADLKTPDEITFSLQALGEKVTGNSDGLPKGLDLSRIRVEEADRNVIAELNKLNLIVSALSKDQHIVEVSAVNAPAFSDEGITLLQKLSDQIVWLKIGGTAISDKALKNISAFRHLNKLYLEYTQVSDEGIACFKDMPYLEYLNLTGTKVSDISIKTLSEIKGLKNLYLWQSAISDSGVAQLRKLRPDLQVVNGLSKQELSQILTVSKRDSIFSGSKTF